MQGSESIGRHAMGPLLRYVSRKLSSGAERELAVISSIRWTISGDRRPWAVGKQGRVSDAARTELDIFGRMDLRPVWPAGALRMRWLTMGAVWVLVSGGRYMLRLPDPDRFLLVANGEDVTPFVGRSVAPKERCDWMVFLCTNENPSTDPSKAASARSTAKQDSRVGAMVDIVNDWCWISIGCLSDQRKVMDCGRKSVLSSELVAVVVRLSLNFH